MTHDTTEQATSCVTPVHTKTSTPFVFQSQAQHCTCDSLKYEDDVQYRPVMDAEHISGTDKLIKIKRDQEQETEFLDALSAFDPEFEGQKHLGFFYKHLDSVINTPWIFELYRFCKVLSSNSKNKDL